MILLYCYDCFKIPIDTTMLLYTCIRTYLVVGVYVFTYEYSTKLYWIIYHDFMFVVTLLYTCLGWYYVIVLFSTLFCSFLFCSGWFSLLFHSKSCYVFDLVALFYYTNISLLDHYLQKDSLHLYTDMCHSSQLIWDSTSHTSALVSRLYILDFNLYTWT